ncbi:MAG: hypothetical protein WC721_11625 [Victivallaceae bacterium]|jgi:hypothetical protein
MGYVFIEPKYIDAGDAENIHIFETWIIDNKRYFSSKSLCGKMAKKEVFHCLEKKSFKLADSRTFAANLENGNNETCGQCVAKLYSDKDV